MLTIICQSNDFCHFVLFIFHRKYSGIVSLTVENLLKSVSIIEFAVDSFFLDVD